MNRNALSLGAACALLLVGCGGGSSTPASDSGPDDTILTGVFVDSPVEGATFATATQSGTTNAAGEFSYLAGEQVTFSIGVMQLPTVAAAAQVSPVDMGTTSSNPAATTTNIARLLQSLDQDGNPNNGITISSTAGASATQLNFDVSVADFESNANVINLVANSGSVTTSLVSASAAMEHLNTTLGNPGEMGNEVFNVSDLIAGSPWYSVRVYEAQTAECGSSYSFAQDGSLSAESNGQNITGTYTLSNEGLININTSAFGDENWQLVSLNQSEWSSNKENNDGLTYLERAFASRNGAIELANSLGIDCNAQLAL